VTLSATPDESPIISDSDSSTRKPRFFSAIIADVKNRVAGQWPNILADVGGLPAESLDGGHHACPKCGGTDRFRLIDADAGAVLCNQCFSENNGDGFAAIQWALGIDFSATVKLIAAHLNVPTDETKTQKPKTPSKPVRISDELQDDVIRIFCDHKKPITVDAVKAAGGVAVNWPPNYQGDSRCIWWPAIDDCGNVTGRILRRVNGADFSAFKKLQARKTHMLKGSKDGLVIPDGWERVKAARIAWKVEGVPDALALFSHLPADHAVITNICGAKAVPPYLDPLAGKTVYIVGDADQPGQDGAERWANQLTSIAAEVRVVRLPYDVTADSGKDLRDYFIDGGTFAELLDMAASSPVWTPTADADEKPAPQEDRIDVRLSNREYEINSEVIAALSGDETIYQRGGQLVTVIRGATPDVFAECPADVPRPVALPLPVVRERIAKAVCFFTEHETADGEIERTNKNVPDWCARAVHARGQWDSIRVLRGIVNHPVMRLDGSILTQPRSRCRRTKDLPARRSKAAAGCRRCWMSR